MMKEIDIGKNVMVAFKEDWSEWVQGDLNWRNFTLIKIAFEDEVCMGACELDLAFFGFGFYVQWVYDRTTPMRAELYERLEDFKAQDQAADVASVVP